MCLGFATMPSECGCVWLRSIRRKQPRLLVPVIPLTFVLAYQYDFAYGHFIQRARHEAENILDSNVELVAMPGGVPGFDELEKARRAQSKLAVLSLDAQR
uniref:Plasminogen receptor, C-terminal lysine transmembrane protein n=1 Tax=Eptatretus burgeri TaxID=7764 RepID=A0A8C4RDK7_EPTBU